MEIEVYQQASQLKDSHWWFLGRKKIISTLLKSHLAGRTSKILDVGCGAGTSFPILGNFGRIFGVDKSEEAIKFCQDIGYSLLKKGDVNSLPFTDGKFDLVASLDLLEHVKNDTGALFEFSRVCKRGGWLVLTVPAFSFLWGENDIACHHFRRYTRGELRKKIEQARFKIKKISYFNCFLFPLFILWHSLWLGKRLLWPNINPRSTLSADLPLPVNRFFTFLFSLEAHLLPKINFPFGLSLICLAQKE